MKILINEKNKEKIIQELDKIHSIKITENLMDFETILIAVKFAERRSQKILKRLRKGFRFVHSLNEPKSKSYKYSYDADVIEIEFSNRGWNLVSVKRKIFFPSQRNIDNFYWNIDFNSAKIVADEVRSILLKQFLQG